MSRILHLRCSPRDASVSTKLAEAFLDAYRQGHPDSELDLLDLFEADLPEFRAPAAKAKYAVMGGEEPRDEAQQAWKEVIEIADRFKAADLYVISTPMWNFSIPYKLKQYIDLLVQPGLTFSYDPDSGYSGLVTDRTAVLCMARGGDYSEGTGFEPYDRQEPYLRLILGFMGIEDVHSVIAQPTLLGEDTSFADALAEARELAERL